VNELHNGFISIQIKNSTSSTHNPSAHQCNLQHRGVVTFSSKAAILGVGRFEIVAFKSFKVL
jgi:hypothetical protein